MTTTAGSPVFALPCPKIYKTTSTTRGKALLDQGSPIFRLPACHCLLGQAESLDHLDQGKQTRRLRRGGPKFGQSIEINRSRSILLMVTFCNRSGRKNVAILLLEVFPWLFPSVHESVSLPVAFKGNSLNLECRGIEPLHSSEGGRVWSTSASSLVLHPPSVTLRPSGRRQIAPTIRL